jgi:hypothetical protein
MSINWSTGIIKEVRKIANKHSVNMDKFSDTDIKEFLNVFNKAIKKVTNKKDKNV